MTLHVAYATFKIDLVTCNGVVFYHYRFVNFLFHQKDFNGFYDPIYSRYKLYRYCAVKFRSFKFLFTV